MTNTSYRPHASVTPVFSRKPDSIKNEHSLYLWPAAASLPLTQHRARSLPNSLFPHPTSQVSTASEESLSTAFEALVRMVMQVHFRPQRRAWGRVLLQASEDRLPASVGAQVVAAYSGRGQRTALNGKDARRGAEAVVSLD